MKPCPFCGKQPKIWQNEDDCGLLGPNPTDWTISCCASMDGNTEEELIKKWNKRKKEKNNVPR